MSSGSHSAVPTLNRMSALVLTLFTFWPPAPPLRAKEMSRSSAGAESVFHGKFKGRGVRVSGVGSQPHFHRYARTSCPGPLRLCTREAA